MVDTNWRKFLVSTTDRLDALRAGIPGVAAGFDGLAPSAAGDGVLDGRIKELIALAIAIAVRSEGCLAHHARAAAQAGASRQEVLETIGVAVHMGGEPAMVHGSQALEAFDQFTE
ncbi:MAG: carboxymuconolactone decarboxylase family protein [Flavobacteriaceae bacterium]